MNIISRLINYWKSPTIRGDEYKNFAFGARGSDFTNFVAITFSSKDCEWCRSMMGMAYIFTFVGTWLGAYGIKAAIIAAASVFALFWLWFMFIRSVQADVEAELKND